MKRAITIGAVVLLAGALVVPVFAQGPGGVRFGGKPGYYGPGQCWRDGRPYGAALPNEEQQTKINELQSRHFEETAPVRNELWAKREQMRGFMAAESLDEARVRALQKEINGLRSELAEKRTQMLIELRSMDPDARFAGRFGGRSYGHKGWGPGPQMMGRGSRGGYGPGWCWN